MSDDDNKPQNPLPQDSTPQSSQPPTEALKGTPVPAENPARIEPSAGEQPAVPPVKPTASALPDLEVERMTDEIVTALKSVYDPEIPADIYELGLIYRIDIADDRNVKVDMSLTSPNCPAAQELPVMVKNAVSAVQGVQNVDVTVVWDPPWDPSRMSDEARDVLNMW